MFLAQIGGHSEEMARLLATPSMQSIETNVVERSIVSTAMLASSTSLMELNDLYAFLRSFEELLRLYRDKHLPWDERIAQLTSEIIEHEDQWVAAGAGKDSSHLADVVSGEGLAAVANELASVKAFATSADLVAAPAAPDKPTAPAQDTPPAAADDAAGPLEAEGAESRLLYTSARELKWYMQAFLDRWDASNWDFDQMDPEAFQHIRRDLFSINFHALSIEQMIGIRTGDRTGPRLDALGPIQTALDDFAQLLSTGTERSVGIKLVGEDNRLDVRLLLPVTKILQNLIGDIASRCEGNKDAHIEVVVREQHGSLVWSLRDNGNSFISDTLLDPDEYLAFYPGLRETCKILSEFHSLLWVEPDDKHDTRFAFTSPVAPDGGGFVVWGRDEKGFAVLSNQLCDVVGVGDIELHADGQGEHVVHDGVRVPVVRLGQLFDGVELGETYIAIIGQLEKRIGFLVGGAGEASEGIWLKDAVPAWRGAHQGVAEIGGTRVTVIEANDLLARYLRVMSDRGDDGIAGAAVEPEVDEDDSRHATPSLGAATAARVLIVERSEALRNALASILSEKRVETELVDQLDAALDCLDHGDLSLIISEFRVPSMAAKALVDRLREQGRDVPVLVTTTHSGENAELLVQKLGASGYISKPLDTTDVLARVDGFLGGYRTEATKA